MKFAQGQREARQPSRQGKRALLPLPKPASKQNCRPTLDTLPREERLTVQRLWLGVKTGAEGNLQEKRKLSLRQMLGRGGGTG